MLHEIDNQRVVNTETGEIFQKQTVLRRKNEVVRVMDPKMPRKNVKHIKLRTAREQKRAYHKLTLDERGFIFSIIPYVSWETNLLIGDGELFELNRPLTWANIDRIVGIDRRTRKKIVQLLEEKKVIGYMVVKHRGRQVKTGIVINPDYVLRGRRPQAELLMVFDSLVDVWEDDEG